MNSTQKKAFILALAVTMSLTGLLFYYLRLNSLNVKPLIKIIVAQTVIPAKSIITEEQIQEIKIPQKFALNEVTMRKEQIIGKIAKTTIYQGEQIIPQKLIQGKATDGLSAAIPQGYRAITLRADKVEGVDQKIKAGDRVDIMVYLQPPFSKEAAVTTVFQKVDILDVDLSGNEVSEYYLTFCLKPEEAEKLFLLDETGKIRLTLRRINDAEPITPLTETGKDSD